MEPGGNRFSASESRAYRCAPRGHREGAGFAKSVVTEKGAPGFRLRVAAPPGEARHRPAYRGDSRLHNARYHLSKSSGLHGVTADDTGRE